jgi:hypothetical protein
MIASKDVDGINASGSPGDEIGLAALAAFLGGNVARRS